MLIFWVDGEDGEGKSTQRFIDDTSTGAYIAPPSNKITREGMYYLKSHV